MQTGRAEDTETCAVIEVLEQQHTERAQEATLWLHHSLLMCHTEFGSGGVIGRAYWSERWKSLQITDTDVYMIQSPDGLYSKVN